MKKINYKPILKFLLYIIIITSIQSIINLIINIPSSINTFISLILISIYIFIKNINIGKTLTDRAYINGIKNGLITILILFILNILTFTFKLTLNTILYYLIILFISVLGAIIGINKKR